jgi:DNA polymerase-1
METAVWDLKAQYEAYKGTPVFDCLVAECLLSGGRSIGSQIQTLKKYKVDSLEQLAQKQQDLLAQLPKINSLLTTIELPLIPVLARMEKQGILLDVDRLRQVGKDIEVAIAETEKLLHQEIDSSINLNSSVQLGNYLATKMGIPLAKTKTGRYATNETELTKHAATHPVIQNLLRYRELSTLRSTFVESLISKVAVDGRLHTTYSQVVANTGRLSSANPNLQNIPVTSDFGQKIKSCFKADTNCVLVSFDYSQQELRILAHLTGETALIDAFNKMRDIHKTTASLLFNTDYDKVTHEQRMIAKTINFGIIYGMSAFGMSATLTIPVEDAQKFIHKFYETYPKISTFYDGYLRQGKIDGYVETLLGRRRYVFEYPGPSFAKATGGQRQKFIDNGMRRVLINFPIQGTAADLMKKAMVEIDREILRHELEVKLLLQIHDDLVFEIPEKLKNREAVIKKIKHLMCDVYPLAVPIEVDVKIGKRWGEMEKVN